MSIAGTGVSSLLLNLRAQTTQSMQVSNLERLSSIAAAAKTGDEDALRNLATEVVRSTVGDALPEDALVGPVVAAELAHRRGKQRSIHNTDIQKTINSLADELGAPEYTKSSARQVAQLRLALHMLAPGLISLPDKSNRESMAPMEAATVTLFLIRQKITNPAFQISPGEWDAKHQQSPVPSDSAVTKDKHELRASAPSDRTMELRALGARLKSQKSPTDVLDLLNRSFQRLGFGEAQ